MAEAGKVNQFKIDTNDVLGFNYQQYIAEIRALALSSPSEYFTLRREVLAKVKRDAVSDLYLTLFNVLSAGTDKKGTAIGKLGVGNYIPGYPSQKINDFCITVAEDLAEHLNNAIDIILPDDFEKIASNKLALKGRATSIM